MNVLHVRRQLILDKHLNGVDYTNGHELNSSIIAAMEEYAQEVINKNDSIHIVSGSYPTANDVWSVARTDDMMTFRKWYNKHFNF